MAKNVDNNNMLSVFQEEKLQTIRYLFQQKNYQEVIQQLKNEDLETTEFPSILHKAEKKKMLTIAYLKLQDIEHACALLNTYKGYAKLQMRNYITNFCSK